MTTGADSILVSWNGSISRIFLSVPYAIIPYHHCANPVYGEICRVRNHFLHGEPVSPQSLIVKRSKRNLFSYAPMLYRMLLTGFLKAARAFRHQGRGMVQGAL